MTTEITLYALEEVKENDFIIIDNIVYDFKSFTWFSNSK